MRDRLTAWWNYVRISAAFHSMMRRRFRAWRNKPREAKRYRERMEQWAKRNRFMPIGPVKTPKAAAADPRVVTNK